MNNNRKTLYCSLIAILLALVLLSFCVGEYQLGASDFFDLLLSKIKGCSFNETVDTVIFKLRFPRIIAAVVFGSSLAISGLVYQNVFSNNMVSPDLLGASSSAACGAAISIIFGFSKTFGFLSAFLFSVFSILATNLFSKFLHRKDGLLIAGLIVGGIARSGLGLLKYIADPENGQLESIVYWEMGSLSKTDWKELKYVIVISVAIVFYLFIIRRRINCLLFGKNAELFGINVSFERLIVIIAASLLVSLSTSICGVISWIGLIVPIFASDLTRSGSIEDNFVTTALIGSIFLLLSDTSIRMISSAEIPISIMTGAGGLIVFVISVLAERKDCK